MDQLETSLNQSHSLNTSITIQPCEALTQPHYENILQPQQEAEVSNSSSHNQRLHIKVASAENSTSQVKSNYSSINNLLPCPEGENTGKSRKQDQILDQAERFQASNIISEDNTFPRYNNPSTFKQASIVNNRTNGAERPPLRNSNRPPLNPNEVAKGLSALHSKVDELLRKKSQERGRDFSYDADRHRRAQSSDARPETFSQPVILAPLQRESFAPVTPDNLLSGRTCRSIEIGLNRPQDETVSNSFLLNQNEYKEASSPVKTKAQQTNFYQDFNQRQFINVGRTASPPKANYSNLSKFAFASISQNDINVEKPKQNSIRPVNSENSFDNGTATKPKYDERKLDAIISRIKERNSVSPAPRARASVTKSEFDNSQLFSLNKPVAYSDKKVPDYLNNSKEVKAEDKNSSFISNMKFSNIMKGEKSEAQNEKIMNTTWNTSIMEESSKKRSVSSPKFLATQPATNRMDTHQFSKAGLTTNESFTQEKKSIGMPERVNRDNKTVFYNANLVADIIRDIQNRNAMKVKESTGDRFEAVNRSELGIEKRKAVAVLHMEDRDKFNVGSSGAGTRVTPCVVKRDESAIVNLKTDPLNQSELSQKDSAKYYCGDIENDVDSLVDHYLAKEAMRQLNSRIQLGQHFATESEEMIKEAKQARTANIQQSFRPEEKVYQHSDSGYAKPQTQLRRNSVERTDKVNESRSSHGCIHQSRHHERVPRLNLERDLSLDRRAQVPQAQKSGEKMKNNLPEEQSPINRVDDESLMLDESIFSIKNESLCVGEMNTDRLFGTGGNQERQNKKPKMCVRTELSASAIKNKYLREDQELSDFDFEGQGQEQERMRTNQKGFKLELKKIDEAGYENKFQPKRQKVEENRFSFEPAGINNRTVKKTEAVVKTGNYGRDAIY